jgi:hypothetical protein
MEPFANQNYSEGYRQAWKATCLSIILSAMFYAGLFLFLRLFVDFHIGRIAILPNHLLLTAVASIFDAIYLAGFSVLLGLKYSRDMALLSTISAIITVSISWLGCLLVPASQTLLLALALGCLAQFLLFNLWGLRRLRQAGQTTIGPVGKPS